ncbi:MAG TPA: translocation/assembly module TamB domain-containing protein, partial [Acidobacteriota bacterium]|nr:translocation/assembly module TamB domain-containing protein [Acidobacteriota bacterium]
LFFPDSLGLRDIRAHIGDGWAQASGDLVYDSDDYNVEFAAENIPLEKLSILKQAGLETFGVASAHGSGHGTFNKPELNATLDIHNLVYRNEPYGDVKSKGELKDGWIRIDASGIARGVESTAHGDLHLDGQLPFRTTLNIEKFPLEILTRAYAPGTTGLTGLVGGKFEINGTLQPAGVDHLAGVLDRIEINWSGLRFEQARPLNVQLSDKVILINDSLLVGSHISASLTGKIFPSDDWRLDLNLNADAGLELLQDLNKEITASGTATARIAIGGTLQNPALTGAAEIKDGFFRHYSFPNSLTDINALFTFKNKSVSLQSLKATSSGGTLTAGGSATIKGYDLDTYRFDLYADHIRVHYPEGLRSTVNSELHLQSDRNASYLVGDINVLQGVYARSFEETPDIFGYARVPTFAALAGAPAAQQPMQLNVHLHSDGDLLVRNNFANIESFGDLNVVGTMDNPVLVGRMEVRKGTITFRNRQYNVVRGALDFQNPYRTEPILNFVAETKVREYNITLNFNGTFDRIYHDLSSDPPLPKDDIYALLGIGNTREALAGGSYDVSTLIAGQQISEFIANPITSPLEREFKKVFGLQRFQIDPTYVRSTNVATARVTVQKDVSQDFSFTYSTNVFTTAEEIILLQYRIKNDIQVTASKDERNRYGIDVLVTKTFE